MKGGSDAVRAWRVGLLVALIGLLGACQQTQSPGLASLNYLLDQVKEETARPPAEQNQERIQSLLAALQEEVGGLERLREQESRTIKRLLEERKGRSPSGKPPLPTGPLVVELQFSFDTRLRDLDGDGTPDDLYVTVWPKDHAADTVKAVGTMQFLLSRQALFVARGRVLQRWFEGPKAVDESWKDEWVFDGHHFELQLNEEARAARGVVLEVRYIGPDGQEITTKTTLKL